MEILLSMCIIKRQFHLGRYDKSVRHVRPYQATAAISGTFLADGIFSKASEVADTGASGLGDPKCFPWCWCRTPPSLLLSFGSREGKHKLFWFRLMAWHSRGARSEGHRPRAPRLKAQGQAWQCQGLQSPNRATRLWGHGGPLYAPFPLPSLVYTARCSDKHCFWVRGVLTYSDN